ncbi:hypothetical protein GCM10027403_04780 [Arthrobacter tecti]
MRSTEFQPVIADTYRFVNRNVAVAFWRELEPGAGLGDRNNAAKTCQGEAEAPLAHLDPGRGNTGLGRVRRLVH